MIKNLASYPCVIVASGPSLTDEQCAYIVRRRSEDACRVIAVSDNYKRLPNADVLFACDGRWWKVHHAEVQKHEKRGSKWQRWTGDGNARDITHHVANMHVGQGLPKQGSGFIFRYHSGAHQSLGLAVLWGARHIVMVGIDCKSGKDGKSHWFGDHPKSLPNPQVYDLWIQDYRKIAKDAAERGIRLVNCSIDTAVDSLIRSTLEEELCETAR